MSDSLVVDASVAIKWIIQEEHSSEALRLRNEYNLVAPELIFAECANILWKKVLRRGLSRQEAAYGAKLIELMDIEVVPMRNLVEAAAGLSIHLDHPAYDCFYFTLAAIRGCLFVTADIAFHRKVRQTLTPAEYERCVLLDAFVKAS